MTPLCPPGNSTGASFLGKKKSGDMETNLSSPWHGNWFLVQSDLPLGPCLASMVPSRVVSNSRSGRLMGTILVIGLVVW